MVVTCMATRCTDMVGSLRYVTSAVLCLVLNKYQGCPPHRTFLEPTMSPDTATQSVVSGYSNDQWDNDPANPRQWSTPKKWLAMGIVRNLLLFVLGLTVTLFYLRFHPTLSLEHWPAL